MALSDKLIPNSILNDRRFRDDRARISEKSDAFVKLFGVEPKFDPNVRVEYDESGRPTHPHYVGKELTKEEIFSVLRENGIVSDDIIGIIKTGCLIYLTAFPDRSYTGYTFVRRKDPAGNVKYRLEWEDFVGVL